MKILIMQPSSPEMKRIINRMKQKLEGSPQDYFPAIPMDRASRITVEIWDSAGRQITSPDIQRAEADLFIDFNLAGFEQSTLTDGIAYNLLNCKQIHILLKDRLPEEKYLAKQLSISMFFYCMDPEYAGYLKGKYPDIPWLKATRGWKKGQESNSTGSDDHNAEILCGIVREVIQTCRLKP